MSAKVWPYFYNYKKQLARRHIPRPKEYVIPNVQPQESSKLCRAKNFIMDNYNSQTDIHKVSRQLHCDVITIILCLCPTQYILRLRKSHPITSWNVGQVKNTFIYFTGTSHFLRCLCRSKNLFIFSTCMLHFPHIDTTFSKHGSYIFNT